MNPSNLALKMYVVFFAALNYVEAASEFQDARYQSTPNLQNVRALQWGEWDQLGALREQRNVDFAQLHQQDQDLMLLADTQARRQAQHPMQIFASQAPRAGPQVPNMGHLALIQAQRSPQPTASSGQADLPEDFSPAALTEMEETQRQPAQQLNMESTLDVEFKRTSQVAALLSQDAALLAKQLVSMNSALRGARESSTQVSVAQAYESMDRIKPPITQDSLVQLEKQVSDLLHEANATATARSSFSSLDVVDPSVLYEQLNASETTRSAASARSTSSTGDDKKRCGGRDQVNCSAANWYFTMNYRIPLWLGVILWVLIWVCIICFCVGLCMNIFKPNALTH